MVDAIALYSASAKERATLVCFLDFQETRESPRKTQNPVTDFLESWHEAQSALENAFNCNEEEEEKNKPWPGLFLRYLSKWWVACKWGCLG